MADEKKTKLSVYISADLERRLRNAVAGLSGPPMFLRISEVAEEALTEAVERLEREYNQGQPWPSFEKPPRRGRPPGLREP